MKKNIFLFVFCTIFFFGFVGAQSEKIKIQTQLAGQATGVYKVQLLIKLSEMIMSEDALSLIHI